ncbi:MAG: CBS domain-containing protein [Solirubrobacteraceae bacterium]
MPERPNILDRARVGDCMRAGIFTCDPHASLHELAATMSSLRIHALALRSAPRQPMPFITDLEVMAGIALSDELQAGDLVAATAATVSRLQSLREAAERMVERGAAHLIVIDETSGDAVGVLSTTDILQAYAAADGSDA